MPRRVDPDFAHQIMLDAGAQPLTPFPGTQLPWRSLCLDCGDIVTPRYNDVRRGNGVCFGRCRAARISAALRRDAGDATSVMLQHGWEPVAPYPGAGKAWKCRCIGCASIKDKRLSHVQEGRGSCTVCSGKEVTGKSACAVLHGVGLTPLVPYPGSQLAWLSRCDAAGHIVAPTYAKVKYRGDGCYHCRGRKISARLRLSESDARASMLSAGLDPLDPYPGSVEVPWRARCLTCASVVAPRLHGIRGGQGGCRYCATHGLDPSRPAYVYLVEHPDFGALKVGIATSPDRLKTHVRGGWQSVAVWDTDDGHQARAVEVAAISWMRSRGAPPLSRMEMPYGGHTETASTADVAVQEMRALISGFIAAAQSASATRQLSTRQG
jgi:hypothetical protein